MRARAAGLRMFDVEDLACPFAIRMERAPDLRRMAPVLDRLQAELQARLLAAAAPRRRLHGAVRAQR